MPTSPARSFVLCALFALFATASSAQEHRVPVSTDAQLRQALRDARPGHRIVIAPGKYAGGVFTESLRGTAAAPIVVEGADPKDRPVFEGGRGGVHVRGGVHLTLRNLVVRGQPSGGINVDDGGVADSAHHITIENVHVADIGPRGNVDGIKLSGLDDVTVRNCSVEGWGGQGIDMVGCHRVLIENCTFRGKSGFTASAGVQAKGGSANVTVRNCLFDHAGERAVNLGGSTSLKVFRPLGARYEGKNITVEGCRFVGSLVPVAFVGVDGSVVRYNTIVRPDKWVVRILQETTEPGFVPSRNGVFERNIVVFRRAQVRGDVISAGPGTDPASFTFKDNLWFCEDRPAQSRPPTPSPEQGGVYTTDPQITLDQGVPTAPKSPAAKNYGADALPK